MDNVHKIGIIGCGFVGSACEVGFSSLKNAEVKVYDKYKPTESLSAVVHHSDILFVCLPTPMLEDGSCDLSIIHSSLHAIDSCGKEHHKTIVIKSTVPPGTTDEMQRKHSRHKFFFNPEFLTEARFIEDFLTQQTIIIGESETLNSFDKMPLMKLYSDFIYHHDLTSSRVVATKARTAELMKYTVNSFLATKVAFCNEIYEICQKMDVHYPTLAQLLAMDERMGKSHLNVPGPDGHLGFGGKCLPKDLNAFITIAEKLDVDPLILQSVWSKNFLVRKDRNWEEIPGATHITGFGKASAS